MSWWMPVIQLGADLLSSKAAGKGVKAQSRTSAALEAEQLKLSQNQDQRAQQAWDRYNNTFVPIENKLLEQLKTPISPNVEAGLAMGDVEKQALVARGALGRNFGRRGINPADGAVVDAEARLALATGLGRAAAATTARRGAKTQTIANLAAASNLGRGLPAQASGFSNSASAGLSDLTRLNAIRLAQAQENSGKAGAGLGESIVDAIGALTDRFGNKGVAST